MDHRQDARYLLVNRFSDFESNTAMASRTFDSADFSSIAVLTPEQLVAAVREHSAEVILGRLYEKLDSLRADQVKALVSVLAPDTRAECTDQMRQALQNMCRSEEWRARLWHLGPNEGHVQQDQQASLMRSRVQKLNFYKDGIGLSVSWGNRLDLLIARLESILQDWAALCEHALTYEERVTELYRATAQKIINEQRWLRDQSGLASASMSVIAGHLGVKDLNFVLDGAPGSPPRSMSAKFTWISFR